MQRCSWRDKLVRTWCQMQPQCTVLCTAQLSAMLSEESAMHSAVEVHVAALGGVEVEQFGG